MARIGRWRKSQTSSGYYIKNPHGTIKLQIYGVPDSSINKYSLHVHESGSGSGYKIDEYKTLELAKKGQIKYMKRNPQGGSM